MSLLIKALDKAQEAKAQTARLKQAEQNEQSEKKSTSNPQQNPAEVADRRQPQSIESSAAQAPVNAASAKLAAANALEMELSPISNKDNSPDIFSITSTFKLQESASTKASANDAANVFAAKRIKSNNQNTILALVAGIALCFLLAVAAYYYLFMDNQPEFIKQRPVSLPADVVAAEPPAVAPKARELSIVPVVDVPAATPPATAAINSPLTPTEKAIQQSPKSVMQKQDTLTENEVLMDETVLEAVANNPPSQINENSFKTAATEEIASKSASIQVSKNQAKIGVNPVLMDAFNAYNAGNDALSGKLYRQVLQQDIRNVDALLGLGAIAQRQGRLADANGWYGKVLEVEPRNILATSAILSIQPQNDAIGKETRIKNMLAKQPEDANLHATLGNFYADLNQWPAAQQAYFDAYRLNASADNAFNLAISLDQLNKPKLALPYYQTALQLSQTSRSNIDKNALQARIAAIQSLKN